jgi:hypothetical protein
MPVVLAAIVAAARIAGCSRARRAAAPDGGLAAENEAVEIEREAVLEEQNEKAPYVDPPPIEAEEPSVAADGAGDAPGPFPVTRQPAA